MSSASAKPFDVVIAGGSFAGLALALALVRAEGCALSIAVIDRVPISPSDETRSTDPRAFALSAGSRGLLEALGVWSELAASAQPVSGVDITDSSLEDVHRPVLLHYDTMVDNRARMLILEADRLRRALVAAVRDEPRLMLLPPAEVTGLELDGACRVVRLSDGRSIRARLVVAADGGRSAVRDLAGIGTVGGSYRQRGIATIVRHERDHGGRAVQHFLPAGPFALLPLPGSRSCITWSEAESRADEIMALDDQAFLAEAQSRAGWRLGELSLDGPRASWPLASHLARSLIAPRLALIGDAARSVHPIAGQGVNLGFRDVAALAEAVVEATRLGLEAGDETILSRYERWRRADGVQSAAAFSALNALFSNDSLILRSFRDAGLGVLERLPALKGLLVTEAAGLTGEVPRLLEGQPL